MRDQGNAMRRIRNQVRPTIKPRKDEMRKLQTKELRSRKPPWVAGSGWVGCTVYLPERPCGAAFDAGDRPQGDIAPGAVTAKSSAKGRGDPRNPQERGNRCQSSAEVRVQGRNLASGRHRCPSSRRCSVRCGPWAKEVCRQCGVIQTRDRLTLAGSVYRGRARAPKRW